MVEMHLLSVNLDFSYDPIFGFGVVSAFDRFMQGYRPDADLESIFNALCRAVEGDPQNYRGDANTLGQWVLGKPLPDVISKLTHPESMGELQHLQDLLTRLASNGRFKYSRLFAIGLFTLLELADPELPKDDDRQSTVLTQLCDALNLPVEKLKKDIALYRSNLEKLVQARQVMEDILEADRKKKEQRTAGQDLSSVQPAPFVNIQPHHTTQSRS